MESRSGLGGACRAAASAAVVRWESTFELLKDRPFLVLIFVIAARVHVLLLVLLPAHNGDNG